MKGTANLIKVDVCTVKSLRWRRLCSVIFKPKTMHPCTEAKKRVMHSHFAEKVYGKGLDAKIDWDYGE